MRRKKIHADWVKAQFSSKWKSSSYRNVLIHTGLIENIIGEEARHRDNFAIAIKILRFSGYEKLGAIEELRKLRNKIVHKVEEEELDESEIIETRDRMHKLLGEIYHKNVLIKDYFFKKYGIHTDKEF
jgi:hypothetical protein